MVSSLSPTSTLESNLAVISGLEDAMDVSEIITDVLNWPSSNEECISCLLCRLASKGEARVNLVMLQERVDKLHVALDALAVSLNRIRNERIWEATLTSVIKFSMLINDEGEEEEEENNDVSASKLSLSSVLAFVTSLLQEDSKTPRPHRVSTVVNVMLDFFDSELKMGEEQEERSKDHYCGDNGSQLVQVVKLCVKQCPPHLLTFSNDTAAWAMFVDFYCSDCSVWPQVYEVNFVFETILSPSLAQWITTGSLKAFVTTEKWLGRMQKEVVVHVHDKNNTGVKQLIEALVDAATGHSVTKKQTDILDYERRRLSMVLLDALRVHCSTSLAFLKVVFDQGGQRGGIDGWILGLIKNKLVCADKREDNSDNAKCLTPYANMARLIMSSQSWFYEASSTEALQCVSSIVATLNTLYCLKHLGLWQRHFETIGQEVLTQSRKLVTRLRGELSNEMNGEKMESRDEVGIDLHEARNRLDLIDLTLARFE